MDSWEFNKIAGAVLAALLVAFGVGNVMEMLGGGHAATKPGYVLPVKVEAGGGTAAPTEAAFTFAKVAELLPKASADSGQAVFKRCTACHTPEKGGKPGVGPNLWGIVGRPVAASESFPRYSSVLKGKGGSWSYESLAAYIHDPRGAIPGNQMAFAGIKDNGELADLLAYLRTLSDNPAPLPQ